MLSDEDLTVDEAVDRIMEWDDPEVIEEIKKSTRKLEGKNEFVSMFWTCMMNCPGDFGMAAKSLVFTLTLDTWTRGYKGIEIVKMDVEGD